MIFYPQLIECKVFKECNKVSVNENIIVRTDSTWLVDARGNNATKTLNVYVQGGTNKNVSWKAIVTTMEI